MFLLRPFNLFVMLLSFKRKETKTCVVLLKFTQHIYNEEATRGKHCYKRKALPNAKKYGWLWRLVEQNNVN